MTLRYHLKHLKMLFFVEIMLKSAVPAVSRFPEVEKEVQRHNFFFCAIWVSLPFLCLLVPKLSLIAEGLPWLSQLYYFQHHDQTLQQITSKPTADVFGIKNYLVDTKRSNNRQPELAKRLTFTSCLGSFQNSSAYTLCSSLVHSTTPKVCACL